MRLHYKNPKWVNSTQVEPRFTLVNFFFSVNRALEKYAWIRIVTSPRSIAFMMSSKNGLQNMDR